MKKTQPAMAGCEPLRARFREEKTGGDSLDGLYHVNICIQLKSLIETMKLSC
jgi:hypothetical protein